MADPQVINQTQTSIPEYARPYVENMLGVAAGSIYDYQKDEAGNIVKDASGQPIIAGFKVPTPYDKDRVAGFTDLQKQAAGAAANLGPSAYNAESAGIARLVSDKALNLNYANQNYGNFYDAPEGYQGFDYQRQTVGPQTITANNMTAAKTNFTPGVSTQSITDAGRLDAFMSPYMQNVVEIQKREAQRAADIAGQSRNAQAVKAGAFGGSRQAIMDAEAARNLALQMGDIQAKGSQDAYSSALGQFNAEQGYGLTAQQSNQSAGLQANLANLTNEQQAAVNNQALQFQASGMNAQQAMQAALANQQNLLQTQQAQVQDNQYGYGQNMAAAGQTAQYGQAAAQLGQQDRQFGANLGLQGLQVANQSSAQIGNMGAQDFNQQASAINLQNSLGTQQQQNMQGVMNADYNDYLTDQKLPYQQLGFMSDMLRGTSNLTQSTNTMFQAPPSTLSTVAGLGATAVGLSKMAKGGEVKQRRSSGLADLLISKIQ